MAKYTNSKLVNYTKLSPCNSGTRQNDICRISPHCVVGQVSVESLGSIFSNKAYQASSNYGIGADGRVGMYVEEKNRSWCTSSKDNDNKAVTIECASDTKSPYAFKTVVYNKLIDLCVDICKRNGKTKLLWIPDKNKALAYKPKSNEMLLTVHRWFANKACPGDWMYSRMGDLAEKVTAKLKKNTKKEDTKKETKEEKACINKKVDPYLVKINSSVYIKKGPGTSYLDGNKLKKGEIYTIVEEYVDFNKNKWGKLKSGAGWIDLSKTSKK